MRAAFRNGDDRSEESGHLRPHFVAADPQVPSSPVLLAWYVSHRGGRLLPRPGFWLVWLQHPDVYLHTNETLQPERDTVYVLLSTRVHEAGRSVHHVLRP